MSDFRLGVVGCENVVKTRDRFTGISDLQSNQASISCQLGERQLSRSDFASDTKCFRSFLGFLLIFILTHPFLNSHGRFSI